MEIKINKKNLTIVLLIIILFLLVGIILFFQSREKVPRYEIIKDEVWEKLDDFEYESVENYIIEETSQVKKVVNNNIGLEFAIFKEWHVEKIDIGKYAQEIELSSPDKITNQNNNIFPIKGCVFGIFVKNYTQKLEKQEIRPFHIKKQIEERKLSNFQEIVSVGNYDALKTTRYEDSDIGESILIEIPIEKKIFFFGALIAHKEKERCSQEFKKFLENILIN